MRAHDCASTAARAVSSETPSSFGAEGLVLASLRLGQVDPLRSAARPRHLCRLSDSRDAGTATAGAPMGQAAVVELAALACQFVGESISDFEGLDRVK